MQTQTVKDTSLAAHAASSWTQMIQQMDFLLNVASSARIGSPLQKRTCVVRLVNVAELHSRPRRRWLRPELAVDCGRMDRALRIIF